MSAEVLTRRSHAITAAVLGAFEIIGCAIITICSFVLANQFDASITLTPYWAGLPYIVPGVLGVLVGVTRNYCLMIVCMIVNIICFVIDIVASIALLVVVAVWTSLKTSAENSAGGCIYNSLSRSCTCPGETTIVEGIQSCQSIDDITSLILTILAFAIINGLLCLAASVVGCTAVCCTTNDRRETVIIQPPVIMTTQTLPAYN